MPLRVFQIAQHRAATPTQIKSLILVFWLESQEPNKCLMDLGWVRPVARYTILQTILAKWQSRNKCWIDSSKLHPTHFLAAFHIFLCLKGVWVLIKCRYKERTVNNPDLVKFHLKESDPSTRLKGAICATRLDQSLSLGSNNVLQKEILRGWEAIILATVAWESLTIL